MEDQGRGRRVRRGGREPRDRQEDADTAAAARLSRRDDAHRAWHKGWTDDIYTRSLKAARLVQAATVRSTGAADRGLVKRTDLTGFNWANVPAILTECGFMSNPTERRLLQSSAYEWKVARGLTAGAAAFISR
ncbi:MAG: N-acetylmuramoyl-L-alanine amidase [Actinobacteria bacterium]|nr:MAG: N-acetylmuramoyl-L-alanine amidase [Actinomycetota bacterium]